MSWSYSRLLLCLGLCLGCGNGQRRSADPPTKPPIQPSNAIASAKVGPTDPASPAGTSNAVSTAASNQPVIAPTPSGSSASQAELPGNSAPSPPEVSPIPPLLDEGGRTLLQTEELPSFDSPSFKRRIQLLFEAIVQDDPAMAAPAFFPVVAYEQVKDIAQPARDHKFRLLAAFARNIHEYHRLLGKDPTKAKFEGIVPPKAQARWMTPGSEGNRLGYYRLLRASLKVIDASGRPRQLEVTSLISWRGQWYVVHLNGFK